MRYTAQLKQLRLMREIGCSESQGSHTLGSCPSPTVPRPPPPPPKPRKVRQVPDMEFAVSFSAYCRHLGFSKAPRSDHMSKLRYHFSLLTDLQHLQNLRILLLRQSHDMPSILHLLELPKHPTDFMLAFTTRRLSTRRRSTCHCGATAIAVLMSQHLMPRGFGASGTPCGHCCEADAPVAEHLPPLFRLARASVTAAVPEACKFETQCRLNVSKCPTAMRC